MGVTHQQWIYSKLERQTIQGCPRSLKNSSGNNHQKRRVLIDKINYSPGSLVARSHRGIHVTTLPLPAPERLKSARKVTLWSHRPMPETGNSVIPRWSFERRPLWVSPTRKSLRSGCIRMIDHVFFKWWMIVHEISWVWSVGLVDLPKLHTAWSQWLVMDEHPVSCTGFAHLRMETSRQLLG